MAITTALIMKGVGIAASAAIGTAASMGAAKAVGGGGGSAGGGSTTIGMPPQLQTGLFTPPTESDSNEKEKGLATAGTFDPGSDPFELREKAMSWMTLGKEV